MIINAAIMTATSLFLRTTGIMYRVFVSERVTAEGMGLHTLTLSVFTFAVTFSTAGINTAVTRLLSEQLGNQKYRSPTPIMRHAFTYALTVSCTVAVLLFLFSDLLSNTILKDARAGLLLKILAPSLPFMAISACIKGYFFACRQASRPAVSDIIEQFTEMGIFALSVGILIPYGIAYACVAIVIGTTISEVASCLYLVILYIRHIRQNHVQIPKKTDTISIYPMLKIAVPVAFSSGIGAGLRTLENILIPEGLRQSGESHDRALSLYGMVRGMVIPVIFFPAAFLSAFSSLLIPELSEAKAVGNTRHIRYITTRVVQLTTLLSVLVTGIFIIFSKEIGLLVYQSTEIGTVILILAPLTALMYADTIVDGMLKGLDLQFNVLWYNIIDSAIRIVLIAVLVPRLGFVGFMIVMYVSNIFNPVLSIRKLLQVTDTHLDVSIMVFKPILAVTASSLIVRCLANVGGDAFYLTPIGLTVGIASVCFCYFVLILCFGCLSEDDILWMAQMIKKPKKEITR